MVFGDLAAEVFYFLPVAITPSFVELGQKEAGFGLSPALLIASAGAHVPTTLVARVAVAVSVSG